MLMNHLLLPYKFKWVGTVLVCLGIVGLVFYIWFDFRLILPVLAVVSSFLETKTFIIIQTNVADELILVSFLAGFFFLIFSKEKSETVYMDQLRGRAFSKAVVANMVLLLFSILFVYGNGFLAIIMLNLFSVFIFYLIFFYFLKRKELPKGL